VYIINIPESHHRDSIFITIVSVTSDDSKREGGGGDILVTSSKKKPKAKVNSTPSKKSIFPFPFGLFTVRVYNTINMNVKNRFNKFWYNGTIVINVANTSTSQM